MRMNISNSAGFTLIELVATVTVLGIVAAVTGPLVADMVSALTYAGGNSSVELVIRDAHRAISEELREAVETPDSLRPWVSQDRSLIRFYTTSIPADSIRYIFSSYGNSVLLKRSSGGTPPELVPEYSAKEVSYFGGEFSVDGGSAGRCNTGKVEINFETYTGAGFGADTAACNYEVFCRNFR